MFLIIGLPNHDKSHKHVESERYITLTLQVEGVVKKHKQELLEKRYKANIGAILSESWTSNLSLPYNAIY
jgi:hypothetical protein